MINRRVNQTQEQPQEIQLESSALAGVPTAGGKILMYMQCKEIRVEDKRVNTAHETESHDSKEDHGTKVMQDSVYKTETPDSERKHRTQVQHTAHKKIQTPQMESTEYHVKNTICIMISITTVHDSHWKIYKSSKEYQPKSQWLKHGFHIFVE